MMILNVQSKFKITNALIKTVRIKKLDAKRKEEKDFTVTLAIMVYP